MAIELTDVLRGIAVAGMPPAQPMRVCRRCGIGAGEDQRAEPICSDGGRIVAHSYVDTTVEQAEQLRLLRGSGWTILPTGWRDGLLLVGGLDHAGDEFVGRIDPRGVFAGEPCDVSRRPEWFGRSLAGELLERYAEQTKLSEGRTMGFWVVFDGPPSHESGRFVELEDQDGHGLGPARSGASWRQEGELWALGPFIRVPDPLPPMAGSTTAEEDHRLRVEAVEAVLHRHLFEGNLTTRELMRRVAEECLAAADTGI